MLLKNTETYLLTRYRVLYSHFLPFFGVYAASVRIINFFYYTLGYIFSLQHLFSLFSPV